MSNCYCLEFSFANISQFELTYTNCSGDTVVETFYSGETYNICSQDFDPITSCIDINFEVKGFCIDGVCPGDYFKYKNECDVTTIFPMGVQCFVEHPSAYATNDGVVSLLITGGTPPYFINWENGSHAQTITNLAAGEYQSTVIDFYGDFTANTICVLTGATPTPSVTPTPTPTPLPAASNLCLITEGTFLQMPFLNLFDFVYDGFLNGKPSWVSSNPYKIYWDITDSQWEVSGWTTGSLVNTIPSSPPVGAWQALGGPPPVNYQSVQVSEGTCDAQDILRYNLTVNQPNCFCDGSIIFNIIDGVPPYEYSVNGITYFPNQTVFQNLCPGTYPTSVIDASGQTFTQTVTLNPAPPGIVYNVGMSLNYSTGLFNVSVTPSLPVGTTITFDIVQTTNFTVAPTFDSYFYNNLAVVNVNASPIMVSSTSSTGTAIVLGGGCVSPSAPFPSTTNTTTINRWNGISMTQGTTVNGTVVNVVTLNPLFSPSTPCLSFNRSYSLVLDNVTISGCQCCDFLVVNPPIVNNEVL